jgi:hypothetical protein
LPIITGPAEESLYGGVKSALYSMFSSLGECKFEITSKGNFSTELEKKLDDYALFIFKEEKYSPDVTGFLLKKESYGTSQKIIVAEVKKMITLANIYQTKRYAEILNADYALLISPSPISERKRRFIIRRKPAITWYYPNRHIIIAQLVTAIHPTRRHQYYTLKIDEDMYDSLPEPFKI